MDEKNARIEYAYKVEGANSVTSEVLKQPVFITFPEKKRLAEVMDHLEGTYNLKQYYNPFVFNVTAILVTYEEDEPQLAHYYPIAAKDKTAYNASEDGVVHLQILCREELEDIVRESGRALFCFTPQDVNPLIEGVKLWVNRADIEEKKEFWSDGRMIEMTKIDLKIRMLNSVNFNREDDAPLDFFCLAKGEDM